MRNCWFG